PGLFGVAHRPIVERAGRAGNKAGVRDGRGIQAHDPWARPRGVPGRRRDRGVAVPPASRRVSPHVLREGMGVLWVAVKAEPRVFTVSVLASALYAAMTVATAKVLGWAAERVVLPAFASGRTTAGALAGAAALIMAVAVLKALGVAGRRFYAGLM